MNADAHSLARVLRAMAAPPPSSTGGARGWGRKSVAFVSLLAGLRRAREDRRQPAENKIPRTRRTTGAAAQLRSLFSDCSAAIRIWVMTS